MQQKPLIFEGGGSMDQNRSVVLFVDDEEDILSSIQRGMIDEEYKCLFANRGKHALELFEKMK